MLPYLLLHPLPPSLSHFLNSPFLLYGRFWVVCSWLFFAFIYCRLVNAVCHFSLPTVVRRKVFE
jgi:hypothetical protein